MQHFIELISSNTGLHVREQDREALYKKIYARMKLLKISVADDYYQLLKNSNYQSNFSTKTIGEREWRELTLQLTISESYFFRDRGQMTLLKQQILPELITHKKAQSVKGLALPSLRIWSAGCSTGEEPYSLAILVKQLIPDCDKWKILILGTDINPESIEKAKRGIYHSWSFRLVDPELQRRYFYQRQTTWEIDEQIHKMVTFRCGNLLKDRFPSPTSDIHNFDIILCRNVFIYLNYKVISVVLEKFYNTLSPGGYLISGHAELHSQNLGQLQTKIFPESVVYQRNQDLQVERPLTKKAEELISPAPFTASTKTTRSPSASTHSLTKDNQTEITSQIFNQAETLFHNGAYASTIQEAERVIKQHPNHFGAYYLMAQAFANLGECEKAIHCCQQALKVDSLSVKPYYLLAHIAEEQGNCDKAKEFFKKIIYLAPSSIAAYLELGSVYESEEDTTKARKMRNTAFDLLKEFPPHVTIEHQSEMTAGELLLQVKNLLK